MRAIWMGVSVFLAGACGSGGGADAIDAPVGDPIACDGSDPSVLFCDDFEDGSWYVTNCDTSGGAANPDNDRWCGTIFAEPITPVGAAVCGGEGARGTDCAATSGYLDGSRGGRNMADLTLSPTGETYREVYWRYYLRTSADTVWSGEKMLTINHGPAGVGGIYFGGVGAGLGGSGPNNTAVLNVCAQYECNILGTVFYRTQNQGADLGVAANDHWYYVEAHIKLNTPGQEDGVWELWMDDCGADGLGCTGAGTLRSSHDDVQWVAPGDDNAIGSLWLENWGNNRGGGTETDDGSIGTHYYDQIVIATRRIGL